MTDSIRSATASPGLPPRVGHILRLAEIIREVDGKHDLGAAALAEALLAHPGFGGCHDGPAAPAAQGEVCSAWQPIETAPRDGAKFLAWDGEELLIAWRYEGRWIYDQEMESPYLTHWGPTHWQPLPIPPITPNPNA
jgi:hypothetical protein